MRDNKGRFVKGHPFGKRFQKGHIPWHKGKTGVYSDETRRKISLANSIRMKDSNHPRWKGEKVSYSALHVWIKRKLGNPSVCSNCGTTSAKRYEWANTSGKRSRNPSDYKRLCVKCHRQFDIHTHSRGENHYFSKLKNEDILKIRSLYSTKVYSYKKIAKIFNVYWTTINKIVKMESWKHIKSPKPNLHCCRSSVC